MRSVLDGVEGGLGCAVADLRTGELLGVAHNVRYFTQTYLEAVAAAAAWDWADTPDETGADQPKEE